MSLIEAHVMSLGIHREIGARATAEANAAHADGAAELLYHEHSLHPRPSSRTVLTFARHKVWKRLLRNQFLETTNTDET